ncbi:MAG: aminodeoxychorismate/anthranilate synthase component II [Myxococcota bacterium]|nr:aminodeoxychorismate/anthranilate synthase component II [Myxococcota bacterium]
MILMLDNYDSFTFNLVQYLRMLGSEVQVVRNDEITVESALAQKPKAIVISPGPCTPDEAGISVPLIQAASGTVPILGVCLGHQSITKAFGGKVVRAERIMHGKTSPVRHEDTDVFDGLENPFLATRYHSLVAERASLPSVLEVTAEAADDNEIMGIRHREHATWGIQFHPESVLTTEGMALMRNFVRLAGAA